MCQKFSPLYQNNTSLTLYLETEQHVTAAETLDTACRGNTFAESTA